MSWKKKFLGLMIVASGITNLCTFQEVVAENNEQSIFTEPVTGMEFLGVKGGCFDMGNSFKGGGKDEIPIHKVCLDDFFIGKYEVTFGEFKQFVLETGYQTNAEQGNGCFGLDEAGNWGVVIDKNWKRLSFTQRDNHPVVCTTWNDAQAFIGWLNQKSGGGFRLLTEAEWEFTARSRGKTRMYATQTGDLNKKLANYGAKKCCGPNDADGHLYTAPVGSYPANDIGVFDLSGNVWEWVSDWYDENYYSYSPQDNPSGPESGEYRIIRGGSWSIPRHLSRCSNRRRAKPSGRHVNTGFRLAKNIPPGTRLPSNSLDGYPLGEVLLVPIGRSFLGESSIEIYLNDRLLSYETLYDDYGGFWAKIPSHELGDLSIIRIRYIRWQNSINTYRHNHETTNAWIKPSRFIDSDNSSIIDKARQLYNKTQTVEKNVKMISDFVTAYLKFNKEFHRAPASLKASQTLMQREGVCINYSRLFIALCRASGIAARSISGVVLNNEVHDQYDFHHEWAEYMDTKGVWHPIDLTYTQTINLSDIRYTDLVYAAEDHTYFTKISNKNLKAGQPLTVENNHIILFHYHPIFPGAKYGFKLIEDSRPDFIIFEKTINVRKIGDRIFIKHIL